MLNTPGGYYITGESHWMRRAVRKNCIVGNLVNRPWGATGTVLKSRISGKLKLINLSVVKRIVLFLMCEVCLFILQWQCMLDYCLGMFFGCDIFSLVCYWICLWLLVLQHGGVCAFYAVVHLL